MKKVSLALGSDEKEGPRQWGTRNLGDQAAAALAIDRRLATSSTGGRARAWPSVSLPEGGANATRGNFGGVVVERAVQPVRDVTPARPDFAPGAGTRGGTGSNRRPELTSPSLCRPDRQQHMMVCHSRILSPNSTASGRPSRPLHPRSYHVATITPGRDGLWGWKGRLCPVPSPALAPTPSSHPI